MSTVAAAQRSLSLQFPLVAIAIAPSSSARHSRLSPLKPTPLHYPPLLLSPKLLHHSISRTTTTMPRRRSQYGRHITTTAIEEGQEEKLNTSTSSDTERLTEEDSSVLKDEALKAAVTRNDEEQSGGGGELWRGVAEEIREIEWPAFGKVVGTTGVVLGVIAGSSVVLLTVNAVLAELSDRVFAGRGVQDFFG